MPKVLFYYDVVCPFAYLGATQIDRVCAEAGAELEWRPILLGGVFRAIGAPDQPRLSHQRGIVNVDDSLAWADYFGVPLHWPARHPRRSVEAMRLCISVTGELRRKLSRALFDAYWVHGRDIADERSLYLIAGEVGLAATDCAMHLADPAIKQALIDATAEAVRWGVFGAPAFVMLPDGAPADEGVLLWGQDRLAVLARALRENWRALP